MKIIAILSVLIITVPFLGVPDSWKTTLIVVFGLFIFFKSFYSYRMNKTEKVNSKDTAFTQNNYLINKEKQTLSESDDIKKLKEIFDVESINSESKVSDKKVSGEDGVEEIEEAVREEKKDENL